MESCDRIVDTDRHCHRRRSFKVDQTRIEYHDRAIALDVKRTACIVGERVGVDIAAVRIDNLRQHCCDGTDR